MLITHDYSPKCLLAFLNCRVSEWLLGNITGSLGGNAKIGQKSNFLKLSVIRVDETIQEEFNELVDRILQNLHNGIDTHDLDREIDNRIYKLYGLTGDEIKVIEIQ